MAQPTSKSRLLKLLRRTASNAHKSPPRAFADEHALWLAHERALASASASNAASQRIVAASSGLRAALDATTEQALATTGSALELDRAVVRVVAVLDRLGLAALNAGLEGARLGESAGRALTLVSAEMRTLAERGIEAAEEVKGGLGDLERETAGMSARFAAIRATTAEIGRDAGIASSQALDAERVLTEMAERMKVTTGSDQATLQAIALATEHARQLVTALATLSGKAPRGLLVGALRPVLEPLLRAVLDDEDDEATE